MARPPVPISTIARRLPEAGRIRLGVKTQRAMKSIDTFRFTSQDEASIEQVASIYGGTVKPWSDPKAVGNQFEVITEANELRIALPPDPLGGTPIYEMWGGGGCERRCDGETCEHYVAGRDGIDLEDGPCICSNKGVLECRPITRMSVLLPEVRFLGVWRLDTKSMNAAQELPGMVELIQNLQAKGITRAVLRVERREQRIAGQTRKFVVPVLGLDASVEQLASGSTALGQIAGPEPERLALAAGNGHTEDRELEADSGDRTEYTHGADDEVVDAELVDDEPETVVIDDREVVASDDPPKPARMKRMMALLGGAGIDDDIRHKWATNQLGRKDDPITSFKQLSGDDVERLIEVLSNPAEVSS